jgi:hypothetical protein
MEVTGPVSRGSVPGVPHVDRTEERPDDWGPLTTQSQAWERGYIHTADGLVCRVCGAVVPFGLRMQGTQGLATAEERHEDWHRRLEGDVS